MPAWTFQLPIYVMMTEVAPGTCGPSILMACVARTARLVQKKPTASARRIGAASRSDTARCVQTYTVYSGIITKRQLSQLNVDLLSSCPVVESA